MFNKEPANRARFVQYFRNGGELKTAKIKVCLIALKESGTEAPPHYFSILQEMTNTHNNLIQRTRAMKRLGVFKFRGVKELNLATLDILIRSV